MRTIVREMSTEGAARSYSADPGALLFGRTRGHLLSRLYGNPDGRFYLRQLVRETGAAQGGVQRELQLLTNAGLVTRTVEGRQVYFQANQNSPVFPELQKLLFKTIGATGVIGDALTSVGDAIEVAFIYGSAAKGTMRSGSDIDLLVVGHASFRDIATALGQAQHLLHREINPTVYPVEEFRKKIRTGHHFLTSVMREPKVFIIGNEDVVDRLAEKRMVDTTQNERSRNRRSSRRRRS
jgi:predicted nucleotidyltransferase